MRADDPALLTDPARYTRPPGPAVLVAGATGTLGGHLVRELLALGHRIVALTRQPEGVRAVPRLVDVVRGDLNDQASLDAACRGVEAVFSCAGASLDPFDLRDRATYDDVDLAGNRRLLEAARRGGVERFLYVSVYGGDALASTAYARAHERFAEEVVASGLRVTVIRPTGFFASFAPLVRLARRGRSVVIGTGDARTNPIHESDLAEICARAVSQRLETIDVGGPETLTRRRISEIALETAGKTGTPWHVPPAALGAAAAAVRPINRRLSDLLDFARVVSTTDVVAPTSGRRKLRDYLAHRAAMLAIES